MTRFGMLYVTMIASATSLGFFAGRWSAPEHQKIVQVQAPVFQAPAEPIPAPPQAAKPIAAQPAEPVVVAPITTVDQLPNYTAASAMVRPVSTMGDNLMPILRPVPQVVASVAPHPVAPVVTVAKPAPAPIVLEEIPDNPYKHKR